MNDRTRGMSVRLIRHGESLANAGQATADPALIALTERGQAQARMLALSFPAAPGLIVSSPFARALATARPTAEAFATTPLQTWPVQEFTYLAPQRCMDTTVLQRRGWVEAYWHRAEPDHRDGEGAETFREFIQRAAAFLDRLGEQPTCDIAVFSHGQFINAVAWLLECQARRTTAVHTAIQPVHIDAQAMRDWQAFEKAHPIVNGAGCRIARAADGNGWRLEDRIDGKGDLAASGSGV